MKYRKKPVVIEAMEFRGPGTDHVDYMMEFDDWICARQGMTPCLYVGDKFIIKTLEGDMTANIGDWIICGVEGELYPCKPDIFAATYELVP